MVALTAFAAADLLRASALAKLATSSFGNLVRDSELILRATVTATDERTRGRGSAVLAVKAVYKGEYSAGTLTIRWTSEVHDQRITGVGADRLLFLKRGKDGGYTGTQYGRSYWPIESPSSASEFVRYEYPTDMVRDVPHILKGNRIALQDLVAVFSATDAEVRSKRRTRAGKQRQYKAAWGSRPQVLHPNCPETMFQFSRGAERGRIAKVCKGASDKDFPTQNGWEEVRTAGGKVVRIEQFTDGLRHGPFKVWHEDGGRWQGGYFKGELHGRRRYFHANGRPWQDATYVHGKLDGTVTAWDASGRVEDVSHYKMGKEVRGR